MTRWNGSLIGVQKNTSLTDSTGVWNLRRQTLAKQNGVWPLDNSSIPQPNWSLDFSSGSPWANNIDYSFNSTTSSSRTFINSSGYVGQSTTNICQYSQDFTNWSISYGLKAFGSGSTSNIDVAPDGTTTADLLTEDSSNSGHGVVSNGNSMPLTKGIPYTFSIYAKKPTTNGRNHVCLGCEFSGVGSGTAIFNIDNGTFHSLLDFTFMTVNSYSIVSAGNGWYRCSITVTANGTGGTSGSLRTGPTISTASSYYGITSYQGDNTSGILLWGAQVVEGYEALPYVITTTQSVAVPRLTHDKNGSRLGLLIEEQRTNRAPTSVLLDGWSVNTITRTTQTSISTPRGVSVNASKISASGPFSSASAFFFQEGALAAGNYTFSIYAKADGANFLYLFVADGTNDHGRYFDLSNGTMGNTVGTLVASSITDVGNGWYRCIITWNNQSSGVRYPALLPSTTNATGRASQSGTSPNGILITAAQFEAASTVSSWIETSSSTFVTRNEDKVHITKSKITNWSSPGAVCVHFYKPLQAGTLVSTDDAETEQLGIQASSTTAARAFWSNNQTATGDIGEPVVQKAIHYWDGTTSKFCINGTTVQTGTNNVSNFNNTNFITLGAEATDSSGSPGTFSNYANCVIRKVEFYAGQLTDTNLQEITNIGNYTSQYVVVAGGAGGGYGGGGGGGAGGYLESSSYLLVPGLTYSVTVGSGGVGGTADPGAGSATNGNNSSFGSITAIGGGFGGRSVGGGGSGGSGGGAGAWGNGATTAGTGTAGQGNAGGNNGYPTTNVSPWAGGGGGGAGSAGTAPPVAGTGGSGGNGLSSSITGTSVTRAGGGGGGVTAAGGIAGAAGLGGGGIGSNGSLAPGAGSTNTGGGGGSGAGVTNLNGAAGGSGVVIIRVPTSNYSGVYTGSPNISQVGDDTVIVFNSSGSYRA